MAYLTSAGWKGTALIRSLLLHRLLLLSRMLLQDSRSSPFRWSNVGSAVPPRRRRQSGGMRPDNDDDGGDNDNEEEEELGSDPSDNPAEDRLRELFRFIDAQRGGTAGGGGGSLRQWQRGGNPWGTSTSDRWHEQVRGEMGSASAQGILSI